MRMLGEAGMARNKWRCTQVGHKGADLKSERPGDEPGAWVRILPPPQQSKLGRVAQLVRAADC